jgi:DNA adenine methylase
MNNYKLKPFFKCPGGKTKLLAELHSNLPKDYQDHKYVELFLGGGALFLSLLQSEMSEFYINDYNFDTFNLWSTLINDPSKLNYTEEQDYYKNRLKLNTVTLSPEERASTFLYLNKNCFNGLIRYNSSGKFNSPAGKYARIQMPNMQLINDLSQAINSKLVHLSNSDFKGYFDTHFSSKSCLNGWFFYFDPPYIPISSTSNFTDYTQQGFNIEGQLKLVECMNKINELGGKFLLSNSSSPIALDLYKDYNIVNIKALRTINSKVQNRGPILEILVKNY